MKISTDLKNRLEHFKDQLDDYKRRKYNEFQLRKEYLDPFAALG